jgi:ATP-dependent RNA helicase DDX54/DBP10
MGFEVQLHEILHRLPSHRQNLLFSATLPSAVAEFAKAGLTNPLLHRLDSEQKISEDLQLCFFDVKRDMKDASLLAILDGVLHIVPNQKEETTSNQAIIFVSTKHHVEYLTTLLSAAGYRTNHIYGSLDQVARQRQLAGFRAGQADLLIVTDVAARGIDIPVMDNVINYDFPTGVKSFIHRVGRTARAGRKGTAWSFITRDDLPYAIDLEAFLRIDFADEAANKYWSLPQAVIDKNLEQVGVLDEISPELPTLRSVMERGRSMFERSRPKASARAHKSAKERRSAVMPLHPAFATDAVDTLDTQRQAQSKLLATLSSFTPSETILEVGQRGRTGNAGLMAARRSVAAERNAKKQKTTQPAEVAQPVSDDTRQKYDVVSQNQFSHD